MGISLKEGSGLESVLAHTNLSTIGTSTIVDVNNIKCSRYCLQVAICVIYKLLNEAHPITKVIYHYLIGWKKGSIAPRNFVLLFEIVFCPR